jgi:hypothetical protein
LNGKKLSLHREDEVAQSVQRQVAWTSQPTCDLLRLPTEHLRQVSFAQPTFLKRLKK